MPLTALAINNLKPGSSRLRVSDGGGLYLDVKPSGVKTWLFRTRLGGKRTFITIGNYPTLSLADARKRVQHIKRLLLECQLSPSEARDFVLKRPIECDIVDEYLNNNDISLRMVFDELVEQNTRPRGKEKPLWSESTTHTHKTRFNTHLSDIADTPVNQIDVFTLINIVKKEALKGKLETARKVKTLIEQIFGMAFDKKYVLQNIIAGGLPIHSKFLKGNSKRLQNPKGNPQKLKDIIKQVEQIDRQLPKHFALTLNLHLALRTSELAALKWADYDSEKRILKAFVHKTSDNPNGDEHLIPISHQAAALLEELRCLTGGSEYLFQSSQSNSHLSSDSLAKYLRDTGINKLITLHGCRHTFSTFTNEMKLDKSAIELQLAHSIGGSKGIYDSSRQITYRTFIMKSWSDYLDNVRRGKLDIPYYGKESQAA